MIKDTIMSGSMGFRAAEYRYQLICACGFPGFSWFLTSQKAVYYAPGLFFSSQRIEN